MNCVCVFVSVENAKRWKLKKETEKRTLDLVKITKEINQTSDSGDFWMRAAPNEEVVNHLPIKSNSERFDGSLLFFSKKMKCNAGWIVVESVLYWSLVGIDAMETEKKHAHSTAQRPPNRLFLQRRFNCAESYRIGSGWIIGQMNLDMNLWWT